MLKNKQEEHFIKLLSQNIKKLPLTHHLGYSDLRIVKNKIMLAMDKHQLTTINLMSFLKLLPKKSLVNSSLLTTAFLELIQDGWIEFRHRTLTNSTSRWIPLATKMEKPPVVDLDSTLNQIYDDPTINEEKIFHSPIEGTWSFTISGKTLKTLNEKQMLLLEQMEVWQNLFFQEFFNIHLRQKHQQWAQEQVEGLFEYNQQILEVKRQQTKKLPWKVNLNQQQVEDLVSACLQRHPQWPTEFFALNKQTEKKVRALVQAKIQSQGLKVITRQVLTTYPELMNFE